MKTLIKSLLLALSLSFVSASLSEAKPGHPVAAPFQTGIYSSVDGKLHIALDKRAGGAVDIQLKSSTGNLLYSQHVGKKEAAFRIRLNLDELTDGEYVLEITNGVETKRQTITLRTNQPTVLSRIVQTEAVASRD